MTKEEQFEAQYEGTKFNVDYALPSYWVRSISSLLKLSPEEIIPHFVWDYSVNHLFGSPLPITDQGEIIFSAIEIITHGFGDADHDEIVILVRKHISKFTRASIVQLFAMIIDAIK